MLSDQEGGYIQTKTLMHYPMQASAELACSCVVFFCQVAMCCVLSNGDVLYSVKRQCFVFFLSSGKGATQKARCAVSAAHEANLKGASLKAAKHTYCVPTAIGDLRSEHVLEHFCQIEKLVYTSTGNTC